MQPRLRIIVLPGEAQVVLERVVVPVAVFIGGRGAEGVGVVPAPADAVGAVEKDSGRVEMVGVD
jgi:hypothetical protein